MHLLVCTLAFPTGQDSATKGYKFLYCPWIKGQWDKLKILPRDGTGQESQNPDRDRPGQPKSMTRRGTKQDKSEKDILKQEKDVLKHSVPGRLGTEKFVKILSCGNTSAHQTTT